MTQIHIEVTMLNIYIIFRQTNNVFKVISKLLSNNQEIQTNPVGLISHYNINIYTTREYIFKSD